MRLLLSKRNFLSRKEVPPIKFKSGIFGACILHIPTQLFFERESRVEFLRMSHGVKRQRESVEKEAARREKEKSQINEYRSLTEDVMKRVTGSIFRQLIVFSEARMTCRK